MYMQRGDYRAAFARALAAEERGAASGLLQTPRPPAGAAEAPASVAAVADPDLVRALQRELAQRGYRPGPRDGTADAATRAAIMAWQQDHGLTPSGEPSEALLKSMLFDGAVRPGAKQAARAAR
jgi:peptidoglycan hydrolase-like protein with peptidoglycan-binding domain